MSLSIFCFSQFADCVLATRFPQFESNNNPPQLHYPVEKGLENTLGLPHYAATTAGTGPYFTMMMVNPDRIEALSGVSVPPGKRDYLHWIVTNLSTTSNDQSKAVTVVGYMPPDSNPPLEAGVDRYSLVFFEHNASHVVKPQSCKDLKCEVGMSGASGAATDPRWINTTDFVAKHGLGNPVAGLTFRSGRGGARRLVAGGNRPVAGEDQLVAWGGGLQQTASARAARAP
jgi:hypothetical protein